MQETTKETIDYSTFYRRSIEHPAVFWGEQQGRIDWFRLPEEVLDASDPRRPRWFVGGETNLCYNAVDRHVEAGRGAAPALLWESPDLGASEVWTFERTLEEVGRLAQLLRQLGVGKGDRVALYMPMIPQAIVAMLACARIGALHVVIFSGYPARAVALRLADCQPSLILTTCSTQRGERRLPVLSVVDEALAQLSLSIPVLVWNRHLDPASPLRPERHLDWQKEVEALTGPLPACVPLASTDPSFILYTAGSDGRSDGIVHNVGGYAVAIATSMEQIYHCGKGDIFWATSDLGWIVGHSYIAYGPLLLGIPSLVYEGTLLSPDPGIWWRTVEKHRVSVMFSAPTALRIFRRYPPSWMEQSDISSLRYLFLAGERCDPAIQRWGSERFGLPVIDHFWQTESGWSITGESMGIEEFVPHGGTAGRPCMGWNLEVVDDQGDPLPSGETGHLLCRPPLPPGTFTDIWQAPARFQRYWDPFPGRYATFDWALRHEDGTYTLRGRLDRIVNIAGHRISIAEVEQVLSQHPAVKQVAGEPDDDRLKTEAICCYVVLEEGFTASRQLKKELTRFVRESMGGIAVPRDLDFVEQLPPQRRTSPPALPPPAVTSLKPAQRG